MHFNLHYEYNGEKQSQVIEAANPSQAQTMLREKFKPDPIIINKTKVWKKDGE